MPSLALSRIKVYGRREPNRNPSTELILTCSGRPRLKFVRLNGSWKHCCDEKACYWYSVFHTGACGQHPEVGIYINKPLIGGASNGVLYWTWAFRFHTAFWKSKGLNLRLGSTFQKIKSAMFRCQLGLAVPWLFAYCTKITIRAAFPSTAWWSFRMDCDLELLVLLLLSWYASQTCES